MNRGTILLILAIALAPAASAQKLRSAEEGSVPLRFGAFAPAQTTITAKPGDTLWTETVNPAWAVKLLDPTQKRTHPIVEGVPAETLLFGYRLSSGYAYCPPLDVNRPTRDVQCYRDVDNDGKFDGGYVTGEQDADTPYFSSFLKALAPVPKYRYEPAHGSLLPAAPAHVVFADMKNGVPRFKLHVGKDPMRNLVDCEIVSPGVCDALGVRMNFAAAANGAVTFTFEGSASDRVFDIMNHTNPLKT